MGSDFINLTSDNLADEHLCCAIADKKHQCGVDIKKRGFSIGFKKGIYLEN